MKISLYKLFFDPFNFHPLTSAETASFNLLLQ
jgi:hypothetical protein